MSQPALCSEDPVPPCPGRGRVLCCPSCCPSCSPSRCEQDLFACRPGTGMVDCPHGDAHHPVPGPQNRGAARLWRAFRRAARIDCARDSARWGTQHHRPRRISLAEVGDRSASPHVGSLPASQHVGPSPPRHDTPSTLVERFLTPSSPCGHVLSAVPRRLERTPPARRPPCLSRLPSTVHPPPPSSRRCRRCGIRSLSPAVLRGPIRIASRPIRAPLRTRRGTRRGTDTCPPPRDRARAPP